jgi:hypothetical protein
VLVGFLAGRAGKTPVPGGDCAGTLTDLDPVEVLGDAVADEAGVATLTVPADAGECGRLVQAVDLAACATSNRLHAP